MKIGFIPIDDRPVCYTLPKQIAAIDDSIELFIPDRNLLGDLTEHADIKKLFRWLDNLPELDALIISLDTLAYGGLIPSRKSSDTFEIIKSRIQKLKEILSNKNTQIHAFSSIMRISNNNINEEEKEYWAKWGKKIFNYSYSMDKYGTVCTKEVPDQILEDYLNTRKRNFEINKLYLEMANQRFFKTLVFSKDDCAQYGFNVQEAKALKNLGGLIKTGADEIPLTLLAKAIKGNVNIAPIFLESDSINLISNYEDISVQKSVTEQINLAGCNVSDKENADILLYINNFKNHQGEIVMNIDTEPFKGTWCKPDKPYMIADIRFTNGSDNCFVQELFKNDLDNNFYGYSAWNTTANSLGSLICAAKIKFLAQNYNDTAFKKLEIIRFLDDWAYQANVRQQSPDNKSVKDKMSGFEKIVFNKIGLHTDVNYKFPWNRLFEVEIELN